MSSAGPIQSETAPERVPSFWDRFVGVLLRPRETFARMQDPDAWFWPAILAIIGYTLYFLSIGVASSRFMQAYTAAIFAKSGAPSDPASTSVLQFIQNL